MQDSSMTNSLTRKRSTPFLSKHESNISGVSLREGKNPAVKSRRYEQLLISAGIYMDDDDKVVSTKECKALCQTLLNADQTVPQDSLFNDDLFKRVCQRIRNKNEARIIRDLKPLHETSKGWISTIRAQTSFNLPVASLSYSLATSSLEISCLPTLLAVLTCSGLQSRYVGQQGRDLHYVPPP